MNGTPAVKDLLDEHGAPAALEEGAAWQLMAAILDGGLDELELGAALALMQVRGPAVSELAGYAGALRERCFRLDPHAIGGMTIVLPAYRGARSEPNLLPLLALGLQRLGVPVLVHGSLDSSAGVASAYVFRELGVMPCASLAQAQAELERDRLAFVPGGLLAPGLSELLALRTRLGFGWIAHTLARLVDPLAGASLRIVGADDAAERALLREYLQLEGSSALLLIGTDGGAYANPRQRPALELVREGACDVLFEAESRAPQHLLTAPPAVDATATAAWTRRAIAGEVPLPLPIVNQLASCLFGAGYTHDLNQAKAIVAVETGSLVAA